MSGEVLVAYATRHEATRGVAASIAEVLRSAGHAVRLEAAGDVGELRAYRGAILGCTIFAGEWMPGARDFLVAHERELERMPVWLFATGPTEPFPDGATVEVSPRLVTLIERIAPRDIALFAGSLQPHHIGAALRALSRLAPSTFSEHRDRAAVERWAGHIASELASGSKVKES